MITLDQINQFLDGIEENIVKPKKVIRGYTYMGFHLEIHDRNAVTIKMTARPNSPSPEIQLLKEVFDGRTLIAEFPQERFEKIVRGEDEIREEDWFWEDEE
jgi:hypothetical protein